MQESEGITAQGVAYVYKITVNRQGGRWQRYVGPLERGEGSGFCDADGQPAIAITILAQKMKILPQF